MVVDLGFTDEKDSVIMKYGERRRMNAIGDELVIHNNSVINLENAYFLIDGRIKVTWIDNDLRIEEVEITGPQFFCELSLFFNSVINISCYFLFCAARNAVCSFSISWNIVQSKPVASFLALLAVGTEGA